MAEMTLEQKRALAMAAARQRAAEADATAASGEVPGEANVSRGTSAPAPSNWRVAADIPAALGRGLANTALSLGPNLYNLTAAAVGTPLTAMGRPDLAPQPMESVNVEDLQSPRTGEDLGIRGPANMTEGQQTAHKVGQMALLSAAAPAQGVKQVLQNAALGGTSGLAADVVGKATGSPQAEMVTNMVAPLAMNRMGSSMAPSREAEAMAKAGTKLTTGQAGGPLAKAVEYVGSKTIGVGNLVANRQNEAIASWNKTRIDDALAPIGTKLPKGAAPGQAANKAADEAIGRVYDDALSRGKFVWDNDFNRDFTTLEQSIAKLPPTHRAEVRQIVDNNVVTPMTERGALAGQEAKDAMSELLRKARDLRGATNKSAYNDDMATILEDARDMMVSSFGRNSAPGAAELLKKADTAYARMARIHEAVAKSDADGLFTPQAYHNSVTSPRAGVTKRMESEGVARGQQEAERARRVLGRGMAQPPHPITGMAVGGGVASPALVGMVGPVLGTAATGAALYSPWGQAVERALRGGLPTVANAGRVLRDANPYGVTGVTMPLNAQALADALRNQER